MPPHRRGAAPVPAAAPAAGSFAAALGRECLRHKTIPIRERLTLSPPKALKWFQNERAWSVEEKEISVKVQPLTARSLHPLPDLRERLRDVVGGVEYAAPLPWLPGAKLDANHAACTIRDHGYVVTASFTGVDSSIERLFKPPRVRIQFFR